MIGKGALTAIAAILVALGLFGLGAWQPAAADDYPSRPITLVIPLPPGGTNDIVARSVERADLSVEFSLTLDQKLWKLNIK